MERVLEFFECMCLSDEHTIKVSLDYDDIIDGRPFPELTVSIFLCNYDRIWTRFWHAVKYIFGYNCKYGHWDSFLLKTKDVDRLNHMLNEYQRLEKGEKD